MQKQTFKKVGGIALGSSMLVLSMLPASSAFAAKYTPKHNNYVSNVTTTAKGLTFTASSTYKPGLHIWYQFRVEKNGKWVIDKKFSKNNTLTLPNNTKVTAVEAWALTQYQAQHKQWDFQVKGSAAAVPSYGAPAVVELSAASSSLVADGSATDTITATVVDANGNVVRNFNGTVTLAANGAGSLSSTTVTLQNGTGTTELSDGTSGQTVTVSATGLTSSIATYTGINYGTATVSTVAPTAAALSLTPATTSVSNNSSTPDNVTVNINDQDGTPMSSATPVYATLQLSGPGTFANGSTSLTEYVANGTVVPVYSTQGQSGVITVTATASGLTSAATTIKSVTTGTPAGFMVTPASSTLTNAGGAPVTVYTVQLVDANGNPVAPAASDALTITDNSASTGTTMQYGTASGSTFNVAGATGASLNGAIASTGTGSYQFAVSNGAEGSGPVTITVQDALTGTTKTVTYTPAAGTASQLAYTGAHPTNLGPGTSTTYSLQAEDQYGNPVADSGAALSVYFVSNTAGATIDGSSTWAAGNALHTATNAQGEVQVTLAMPSSAAQSDVADFTVTGTVGTQTVDTTVTSPDATASALDLTTTVPSTQGENIVPVTWPGGSMTAGESLSTYLGGTAYAAPVNPLGAFTGQNDALSITSSNPNVLSVGASGAGTAEAALPAITAEQAGTATLTITDTTTGLTWSHAITVVAGSAAQVAAINPNGTSDTAYAFPTTGTGLVGPFTLQVQDAGGNPAPLEGGPITLTTAQVDALLGVSTTTRIATSSTSGDVSSVTIPNGQESVQVWIDNGSGSLDGSSTVATGATALSALSPEVQSASISGDTVTLTFSSPLVATGANWYKNFTNSGTGATATSGTITGSTVTLTFAAAPSGTLGYTATSTNGLLEDGYGAAIDASTTNSYTL